MISTRVSKSAASLTARLKYNKIEWTNGNPYNLRWQSRWKHAYYTYPKDNYEHTNVKKPEETPEVRPPLYTYLQDVIFRTIPSFQTYW